jgi:hypothetical protein
MTESPKRAFRRLARPLPHGKYTLVYKFENGRSCHMPVRIRRGGHLEVVDAPYPLGEIVDNAIRRLTTEQFHAIVQTYLDAAIQGALTGKTSGAVQGQAGSAEWSLYDGYSDVFNDTYDEETDTDEDEPIGEARALVAALLNESPEIKTLKANSCSLSDKERSAASDAPIRKSVVNGKTWYWSTTHRCYQARPSLKAAVDAYWKIVEPSG